MADSLSFNSIDLANYGVTVLAPFMPIFSVASAPLVSLALSDGGVSSPNRYPAKAMSVPCIVKGAGYADLLSKLDSISKILGERDLVPLSFDHISDRYWMSKIAGEIEPNILGSSVAQLNLPFLSPDPHAFATSETTIDSGSVPGTVAVTPGGTVETYPIITVVVNAACTGFSIANDTLGESIEWTSPNSPDTDLVSGDIIILDCRKWYKTFSIQRVAEAEPTIIMNGIEGIFPQMSPGISNDIVFTTISGSSFSIVFNDRYQ